MYHLSSISSTGITGNNPAIRSEAIGGLLLYGAGFVAYVAHITWRYPALVDDGYGLKLLIQYRFLFGRFKDGGNAGNQRSVEEVERKRLVEAIPVNCQAQAEAIDPWGAQGPGP